MTRLVFVTAATFALFLPQAAAQTGTKSRPNPRAAETSEWKAKFIDPMIASHKSGSCEQRRDAFTNYFVAARQLLFMEVDPDSLYGSMEDHGVGDFVQAMEDQCEEEVYDICVKNHDFSSMLIFQQHVARERELLSMPPREDWTELMDKCLTFELEVEARVVYADVVELIGRAHIPLKRDPETTDNDAFVVRGEKMPTPEVKARSPEKSTTAGVRGVRATKPMEAAPVKIFADTVGANRMREAQARVDKIEAEIKAVPDTAKNREARLKQLNEALAAAMQLRKQVTAQYTGKALNKPRRIEILFYPGEIAATMAIGSRGATIDQPVGEWYLAGLGVAFEKEIDMQLRKMPVVFTQKEIEGGRRIAHKAYPARTNKDLTVYLTLTMWHKPGE